MIRFILIFTIATIVFAACSDPHNEEVQICKPAYALSYTGDSIVYDYDANRLTSLSYFSDHSSTIAFKDQLEFDGSGNVIGMQKIFVPTGIISESYTLSYSGGRPDTLKYGPPSHPDYFFTAFKYDDKGRLTERNSGISGSNHISDRYRYEYNEDDNVIKTFFSVMDEPEFLGWENTSFDNYPRFFATTEELEIVNIFIYKYEPSKNNKLTAVYNAVNPRVTFTPPADIIFTSTYNEGLIESHSVPFHQTSYIPDFVILKLKYNCE
jgi:YD repeat-containing protein